MSLEAKINIPWVAIVAAGKTLEDSPITGWREIRPLDICGHRGRCCIVTIQGDSLRDDGILDGDVAVVKMNFEPWDIRPGRLVVILTPYGIFIKHLYQTLNGYVRLVSANPEYEDLLLESDLVQILGIVVRVERDYR